MLKDDIGNELMKDDIGNELMKDGIGNEMMKIPGLSLIKPKTKLLLKIKLYQVKNIYFKTPLA